MASQSIAHEAEIIVKYTGGDHTGQRLNMKCPSHWAGAPNDDFLISSEMY